MRGAGPDILGFGADQTALTTLFMYVRTPSRHSGDGEGEGKELARNLQGFEEQRRIELDIGMQLAPGLTLAQQLSGVELDCARKFLARRRATQALVESFEHGCPRITYPIDTMSHPHDPSPSSEFIGDPGTRTRGLPHRVEHVEYWTWGTTMQRPFECTQGSDHRGDNI